MDNKFLRKVLWVHQRSQKFSLKSSIYNAGCVTFYFALKFIIRRHIAQNMPDGSQKNPGTYNGKQNREGLLYCFHAQITTILYEKGIIMQECLYYDIILVYFCVCVLRMYVCMHLLYVCKCVYVCMYVCMYPCVCAYVYVYVRTVVRIYVYVGMYMHVGIMCVCVYVCVYV